jgi:ParB-like chromosome segregation protein Spo0J
MAKKKSGSSPKRNGTPKYQPMPDLSPDEFELLKADIKENGLQYPIIQDEYGITLDGHQRERALRELKIKNYPVQVIGGLTEEEKWQYALSVNVKRRHLTSAQKRELIKQELIRTPDIANNWLAEIIGVDVKTVQAVRRKMIATLEIPKLEKLRGKDGKHRVARYNQIIANTPKELEIARSVISDLPSENGRILDTISAQRRARRNVKSLARNINSVVKPSSNKDIRLFHCRFQDLEQKAKLKRNSVSLVLTDFPYHKGFLPQLSELSEFCDRVLKPGGLLVTYSGQYHLPEVLERLGEHLTYRWQMASIWRGDSNMIHPLQITSQWKPILIFSKRQWKKKKRWSDVSVVHEKDKSLHDWQQHESEVEMLVQYFSEPKELVCDCMAGSFTTAVACRRNGRKFVGCDVDAECVEIGHSRLESS